MFRFRTRTFHTAHTPEVCRKLPPEAISYQQIYHYFSANLQLVEGLNVH